MKLFHYLFFLQAEHLLIRSGDFLVRESAKIPGQFILSGRHQNQFKHLLLVDPEGVVSRTQTYINKRNLIQINRSFYLSLCYIDPYERL